LGPGKLDERRPVAGQVVFWARVLVGVVIVAWVLYGVHYTQLMPSWSWGGPLLFMACKLLADLFPIKLRDLEFTIGGAVLVAAAIVFPEPVPVLIAVVPSIAADLWRRKSWDRTAVNAAADATTVFVASMVYASLDPRAISLSSFEDMVVVAAVVGSYYFFSTAPPALMVSLMKRQPVLHVLRANMYSAYMDLVGLLLFGVLTAYIWMYAFRLTFILISLGVIIYKVFELAGRLNVETVQALQTIVDVVDERDRYTYNHSLLVAEYSRLVAEQLVSDPQKVETIVRAAYLHDIGKIGIADGELNKPGPLSESEYEKMKKHPAIGARILASYSQFREGAEIVLAHQERYDGSGYPNAIRGDEIPIGARIIAVVDAYVAMTTNRPYRLALSKSEAVDQLRQGIGTHFDPVICAIFLKLLFDRQLGDRNQVDEMERLRSVRHPRAAEMPAV
jgi:putative nucleotidyltransferase with HDIG domain